MDSTLNMVSEASHIALYDGDPSDDGVCIGTIAVQVNERPMRIVQFLVTTYYREHGLGTLLLNQALQEIVEDEACILRIDMKHGANDRPNRGDLVPWLTRFGFVVLESTDDHCTLYRRTV